MNLRKSVGNMALHFSILAPAEDEVEFHDLVGQWKEGLSRFTFSPFLREKLYRDE